MDLAIVIAVVVVALAFDYTNGFHDAANAIATSVSTRALTPRVDASYQGSMYTNGNNRPATADPLSNFIESYTVANARVTWRDGQEKWEAALELTNFTDEYYFLTRTDQFAGAGHTDGQPGRPRNGLAAVCGWKLAACAGRLQIPARGVARRCASHSAAPPCPPNGADDVTSRRPTDLRSLASVSRCANRGDRRALATRAAVRRGGRLAAVAVRRSA